jgi:hypothetical protein
MDDGDRAIETTGVGACTESVAELAVDPPAPLHVTVYVYEPAETCVTFWLPAVATEPVHAPLAEHWLAPVADHVSRELWPAAMVAGMREIVVTGGAAGADEPPPQPATSPKDSSASARPAVRTNHPWRLVGIEVPSFYAFAALSLSRSKYTRTGARTRS